MIVEETKPFCDAGFCLPIFDDFGFSQYSYTTVLVILTELIGKLYICILLNLYDFVAGSGGNHPEPMVQIYQCHWPYSWSHPIEGGQCHKLSFLKLTQYPPNFITSVSHYILLTPLSN